LLHDADGKLRVVAQVATVGDEAKVAADLRAAQVAHDAGLIVALDAIGLRAARAANPPGKDRRNVQIVAIADAASANTNTATESLVVEETGAAVAVELGLLACNGIAVPPRVAVGTRTLTAANAGNTPMC
jgi:hypothetical protein